MAGSGIVSPGQQIRPVVDEKLVLKIIESNYDLKVLSITELNSFDDKNFRITCSKTSYVLKILNSLDSENSEFVDCQNKLMFYLQQNGVKSPVPQKLKDGSWYKIVNFEGKNHLVRLVNYFQGKILNELSKVSDGLLFNLGVFTAKLDSILKDFYHLNFDTNECFWSVKSLPQIRKFIFAIENPDELILMENVFSTFEREATPLLDTLEQGIIHGDISATNVIVDESGENVDAIIDFGICHKSCLIFELGTLICYISTKCRSLVVAKRLITGYQTLRTLDDLEKKLLKLFVCARFAQTIVMRAYSFKIEPSKEYVNKDLKGKTELLKELWNMNDCDVLKLWGLA